MPTISHPLTNFASLLFAFILLAPVDARVIGEDEREPPSDSDIALIRALGLVSCASVADGRRRRSAGTATLVGNSSTVLTAAHIFIDEARGDSEQFRFDPISDCVFRQFGEASEVTFETGFTHTHMGPFWFNAGAPNQDWAVLRTSERLPESAIPLQIALDDNAIDDLSGLQIRMLAFHIDLPNARRFPMVSAGELFGIDYGGYHRLAHTADSGRMSSGAALIYQTDSGQDIVVGINRSSANLQEFNLAVPVSAELEEAVRSLAFGQVPSRRQRLAFDTTSLRTMRTARRRGTEFSVR